MEELYDTIENYLQNRLSESEKTAFEQRIKSEPDLATEVEAHRTAQEAIEFQIAEQMRADFKAWGASATKSASATKGRIVAIRRVWAVAASVLLLIAAVGYWQIQQRFSSDALANAFYDQTELSETRGLDTPKNTLSEAVEAIRNQQYEQAIQQLNTISDTSSYAADAQYLMAVAHFEAGHPEQGTSILQQLQNNSDQLLSEKADWLLLLTYLKNGQKTTPEFNNLLEKISQDSNHAFYPKAKALKQKLDQFWADWAN
ncbi:MAG TPA: tetratricopeptide repeat protein [Saprospiraceae bacterium]|nr:tetratricopeptide repeat protein [Saprospiraceae bacterium]HMQ81575.1 tetratricopeptide repeat protein [Saprospiraceae bacterium]